MIVNGVIVEIVKSSILEIDVDVIVNAANVGMRGGGGLDGAVHRGAGPDLLRELLHAAPNGCKTSEVVVTKGHRLPFRNIIHTPGPVWRGGTFGESDLLAECYSRSLQAASELNATSLGFPAISTGIYGYPLEKAAPIALGTVSTWLKSCPSNLRRVVFAMFGDEEFVVFQRVFESLSS